MAIESLSHITLLVADLERTARMLMDVLDAVEIYDSGAHRFSIAPEKFLLIGGVWIAIMEGSPLPERSYRHVAFKIAGSDFDLYRDRIARAGLELRTARARVQGEGESIYFYDYDNHLFELHTGTLQERLQRYDRSRTENESTP
jgi:catechol 2,3-dioxygenase-like lactoylglutathione lyase family enzyme